ncbi:MAG TPA: pyridine nucleotide-disulfide oxidoreductase, partial [Clostridia bacterium]|nr:pyridine nucleotide-disulfide oxidoreductase [Clostridia bacterium]
ADMETTSKNILVAGDLTGIEEASTALDEGRMAGCRAAYALGYLSEQEYEENKCVLLERLNALRCGPFGEKRRTAKEALWNAME